jgi:ABC-type uncharacterized transport system involved in gliding motility auxiliary subunit
MNRKLLGTGGLGLALLLLFSVNVVSNASLRSARMDLTEDGLYTLSENSEAILAKLEENVTLRLYFSAQLAKEYAPAAGLLVYARRVEELLDEYASQSRGRLTVEVHDPEPFTEVEDDAVRFGLSGVPLPDGRGTLYFGLAGTNSVDDVEVLPFFQPEKEAFLEYDLARVVHRLAHPERPTVGLLSMLPIEGALMDPRMLGREMPEPWLFLDSVRQLYETQTLQPSLAEVPAEVDVLLVVHPKDLPERALYAIDQFVLRGGKLLAFVDPHCEADVPPPDPQNPMAAMMAKRSSTLGPLFGAWGVELAEGELAGDFSNALKVNYGTRTGREEPISYVLWLQLGPEEIAEDEVVTDGLSSLRVGTAGILAHAQGASTTFKPLFSTSPDSERIPASQIQFQPDPAALLATFFSPSRPEVDQPLTLAAYVSGPAASAFPEGRPAGAEGEEPEAAPTAEHLASSQGPISVVVVADCDLLADRWWAQAFDFGGTRMISKTADNGDLVTNALDFLGGSTDLIGLRGRGRSTRPFTVVAELQREAEAAFRAEEQRLTDEQQRVEQRLNELLTKQEGTGSILITPEVEAEIERLREEQVKTRANLRRVRRDLEKDVEALGTRLKLLNIAAVPILVALSALGLAAARGGRRRNA